jgi:hypothetical protein
VHDRLYLPQSQFLLAATCGWVADESAELKRKVGDERKVGDDTFKCITDMTPVRRYSVHKRAANPDPL